jgi:ketosteroid isomerase-like protein
MQTLDDAWNAQDVETFRKRHKDNVVVTWPGGAPPTVGIEDHVAESVAFWKTFPDQRLDNQPYRVFFASGDWTCSIARFRGTMLGPMKGSDGKEIPPTGKSFEVDFCTVAHWEDGQITEENLFLRSGRLHETDWSILTERLIRQQERGRRHFRPRSHVRLENRATWCPFSAR